MKALVTGGGGFIGSNLVRALLARGDDVRVLDNFSTGSRRESRRARARRRARRGRSPLATSVSTRPCAALEVVFHQGALPSVPRSVQDPLTTTAVNIEGTLNVLLAARDEGVRRIVYASSSSVYGNSRRASARRDAGARPDLAVRRREARGRALLHELQPRVRRWRSSRCATSTSSGPRQDPTSQYAAVVPLLHPRDRRRRAGDDLRRRRAVARLHLRRQRRRARTCSRRTLPASSGEILNVATGGAPMTVNALAEAIGRAARQAGREGATSRHVTPTCARRGRMSSEARRLLGYEPQVGLRRRSTPHGRLPPRRKD